MAKKSVVFCHIPSAVFFALGLAFAVLDMYQDSLGALARMQELDARLKAWDQASDPGEAEAKVLLANTKAGKKFFDWAGRFGWLSAIFFVVGAYPFALLSF